MGQPAAVMGDRVSATCAVHQIPNPTSGLPQPAPPLPFSAPLLNGLATSVLIGGKPAVVVGSSGVNTPPHVGLHASDPCMAGGPTQTGTVVKGSATVVFERKPAARSGDQATVCLSVPGGVVAGTGASVMIGG